MVEPIPSTLYIYPKSKGHKLCAVSYCPRQIYAQKGITSPDRKVYMLCHRHWEEAAVDPKLFSQTHILVLR